MVSRVTGDDLVVAALLLGVEQVAADREGRPARSDRPAPQLDRRRRRPVGLDPRAADDAVAPGSAKAGPVGSRRRCCRRGRGCDGLAAGSGLEPCLGSRRCCRSRRPRSWLAAGSGSGPFVRRLRCRGSRSDRRRLIAGFGHEPFLGSLRPPPLELRIGVAGDALGPHEREHSAREQDGRDHRRAPRSVREATAGHRPDDEGEAEDRHGVDDQQHPHHPRRDRRVDEARRGDEPRHHQGDRAQALRPGCPAEEHPPQDDGQPTQEPANHPEGHGAGHDDGDAKPRQPLQQHGNHPGPQPEGSPRSRSISLRDGHGNLDAPHPPFVQRVSPERDRAARSRTRAARRAMAPVGQASARRREQPTLCRAIVAQGGSVPMPRRTSIQALPGTQGRPPLRLSSRSATGAAVALCFLVLSGLGPSSAGESEGRWPQFRGRQSAGVADGVRPARDAWDGAGGRRCPLEDAHRRSRPFEPDRVGRPVFVTTAISSRPDASFKRGLYGEGTASRT